jgi:hypothetical protein
MPKQDTIYQNLDRIHSSPNVIDTLVEVDRILDRMDVYAYENWISGEIVDGPFVERHWVDLTLMYPHKMMPNPDAAMRLVKNGCKVKYGQDVLETFAKVKSADDLVANEETGERTPRVISKHVWLVNLRIPKTLLNVSEELSDIDDIDYDSVDAAYEEELDGAQGLVTDEQSSAQSPTQETPENDQTAQV